MGVAMVQIDVMVVVVVHTGVLEVQSELSL